MICACRETGKPCGLPATARCGLCGDPVCKVHVSGAPALLLREWELANVRVASRGLPNLRHALALVFSPHAKATHYVAAFGRLTLLWFGQPLASPLPFPLTAENAPEFVDNWLAVADYPEPPDTDGSTAKGWLVAVPVVALTHGTAPTLVAGALAVPALVGRDAALPGIVRWSVRCSFPRNGAEPRERFGCVFHARSIARETSGATARVSSAHALSGFLAHRGALQHRGRSYSAVLHG